MLESGNYQNDQEGWESPARSFGRLLSYPEETIDSLLGL